MWKRACRVWLFEHRIGTILLRELKAVGLHRHDRLLDIGCGTLRRVAPIIRWLEPNNYYGFDKAPVLDYVATQNLGSWRPRVWQTASFDLSPLGSFPAKVALAHSVFTHLDHATIIRCLDAVRPMVTNTLLASVWLCEGFVPHIVGGLHRTRPGEFSHIEYPLKMFERFAKETGWTIHDIHPYGHPAEQQMMVFR